MKSATVRELKNNTSALLRRAAKEDVMITSRGRPIACLIRLDEHDLRIRPNHRGLDYANEHHTREAVRLLERIWKVKPDKGKNWISAEDHDRALYGDLSR